MLAQQPASEFDIPRQRRVKQRGVFRRYIARTVSSIATVAVFAAMPILLAVPMATLAPQAAPGGIALINCIGLTGGFFSPFMLGWIKTATGNLNNGLYLIAALLVVGAVIIAGVVRTPALARAS